MKININVDDKAVRKMMADMPKQASRAAEKALDFTAARIGDAERTEMLRVFDNPTQFTLNSLKVTPTRGHNMVAKVGLKEPSRMGAHYLAPTIEGGRRKLKGFERGLGSDEFVPAQGASVDSHGNIKVSQIKAGLNAVKSGSSAKYVRLVKKSGKLWPGLYQRVKADGAARRKRGAYLRGLKPVMIEGRTGHTVNKSFHFYSIAHRTYDRYFVARFTSIFNSMLR